MLHCPQALRLHQARHICVPQRPEYFSSFSQLQPKDMQVRGEPHQESVGLALTLVAMPEGRHDVIRGDVAIAMSCTTEG